MPLLTTDIKAYKPANISDTSSGGGVITTAELVDVVGALFANVDDVERAAGSVKWRKMFFKLTNTSALTLYGARIFQDFDTTGDDTILFGLGTATDTAGSVSSNGAFKLYSSLPLLNSVLAGSTDIVVDLPVGISNFFTVGDSLRITDKTSISSSGNEEFTAITAIAASGTQRTLTVSPALSNGYATSNNTRIMNVLPVGDLVSAAGNSNVTSTAGTFDTTKVTCYNLSTVDATWTLTFTSSSAFTATSSLLSSSVTGNISSAFSIANPTFSGYSYFSIDSTAFGGTYVSGDVVSFQTTSATVPLWLKRVLPAGTTPIAVNKATFVLDGGTV